MQQNPKAVLIAGVGAMVIALLAGIIGGVAFGTLLLRAILGGVVFAVGAIAVQLLVRRFLPELTELSGGSSPGDVGGRVDMVVDEDIDLLTPVEEPAFGENRDETGDEEESEMGDDVEELVEEVSEVGQGDDVESPVPPRIPDVDVSSVDKLPDLDGFVDSFQDDGTVEIVDEDDDGIAMPGGQDAQTIAKAIQTVMKRDE
ncbi:MAG: hypothetical protein ACOCW6_04515 [Spirochaetota bacterium]